MTNSAKTPSGKARKGTISVRPDGASIKACFPRSYCGEGKQIKLATGINPDDWEGTAKKLQRRLQLELEEGKLDDGNGNFNAGRYQDILEEYGLRAQLRLVKSASASQPPPKPELSILEVWDIHCEFIRVSLKETVYELKYRGQYLNYIKSAISETKSEDAVKIKNWLVENRNSVTTRLVLAQLSKAHQYAIKLKLVTHNPFDGMADEVKKIGARGKTQQEIEADADNDLLDKAKAYTWDEAQAILNYVENNSRIRYWHNFIKFKFLTGCRTGEAIAFMWGDIFWEKEQIVFRRTYDGTLKKFLPTKNETSRLFPMPRGGELWELLKSIPQGDSNSVVFTGKKGKVIVNTVFRVCWCGSTNRINKGIIPTLVEQGKLTKYLSPYNTRHTFITHQIFDLGRDEKIVNAWCKHSGDVSQKHYQDIGSRALDINPDLPANQSRQRSRVEILEEQLRLQSEQLQLQQELINKLLADK
ncbi:MAG: site-specific integrase [Gloeotrichia echinulata DEX184]|nr:tyrosine-type recombinase/integrase [Gloeotrichia echinulata DEX184]